MNKYRAKPVTIDGIRFASKREANRYSELRLLEKAGVIRNLELQPKFALMIDGRPILIRSKGYPNGRAASFKADFAYFEDNRRVIEDSKGVRTEAYALRRAVVEAIYGIRIDEV